MPVVFWIGLDLDLVFLLGRIGFGFWLFVWIGFGLSFGFGLMLD